MKIKLTKGQTYLGLISLTFVGMVIIEQLHPKSLDVLTYTPLSGEVKQDSVQRDTDYQIVSVDAGMYFGGSSLTSTDSLCRQHLIETQFIYTYKIPDRLMNFIFSLDDMDRIDSIDFPVMQNDANGNDNGLCGYKYPTDDIDTTKPITYDDNGCMIAKLPIPDTTKWMFNHSEIKK